MKKICIRLIFFASLILFTGILAIRHAGSNKAKLSGNFDIQNGDNIKKIAHNLHNFNFIDNPILFEIYARILSKTEKSCHNGLKYGEYAIQEDDNLKKIILKMCNNDIILHSITIPEGLENREIFDIINNNDFLIGNIAAENVKEGSMLPETYLLPKGMKKMNFILQMQANMDNTLEQAWNGRDKSIPLKDKNELLILASVVEKEAKVPAERQLIASVYLNRIAKGMKLQADPTTIYEITKGEYKLNRPLTLKDLKIKGEYNTYFINHLPKTPIANAGKEAIFATANPAKTNYLYFVLSGVGDHSLFAENYKTHLENVNFYRKNKNK